MKTSHANGRRTFLRQLTVSSLSPLSIPFLSTTLTKHETDLLSLKDYEARDENYWEMVKRQFAVPDDYIMMNAANLCPSPMFVSEKVEKYTGELSRDVSFQYRAQFTAMRKKGIEVLAKFINAHSEEIGITRNTSESNGIIVNGIDLKQGDEVIIWDQNHPSNGAIWEKQAKRRGYVVKKVSTPAAPKSVDELIQPFEKAITGKTRLIAFSHISNTTGVALPAKQLCSLARSRNILTLIDGAQALGAKVIDVADLGCDFYTASTHKWLMGPLENGLLFVRRERIENVWPSIAGGGWKEGSSTVDEKVCVLGQRNDPTTASLPDTVEFHQTIGKEEIENRVTALSQYLKDQLVKTINGISFVTPYSPDLSAGVVIFNVDGKPATELYSKLYAEHKIASAPSGGVRLSPHVYNTLHDIDRVVNAIKASL